MVTDVATSGGSDRFVRLATVGDVATARVCAALLEADGIEVRVHGESLGPYPMTVGEFAETELWVPNGRLEDARQVMLEAEVTAAMAPIDDDGAPVPRWVMWLVALTIVALVGVRVVANLF
ncbi:MAG: DUF2007 domain-containing protein [Acidimicrobiia bacterium]|nr:DUF2007 domain-containing protein [Acidimicrobiia bacterium]